MGKLATLVSLLECPQSSASPLLRPVRWWHCINRHVGIEWQRRRDDAHRKLRCMAFLRSCLTRRTISAGCDIGRSVRIAQGFVAALS